MKYVIYKLVEPNFLQELEADGYYTRTIKRSVLEPINIFGIETEHYSVEAAYAEIQNNSKKLTNLDLTVIPVISVGWDGEVR